MNDDKTYYNIVMTPSLLPAFKDWLKMRGLHLAGPISSTIGEQDVGSDSSFYGIGIGPHA